jgi:hypothetical protein
VSTWTTAGIPYKVDAPDGMYILKFALGDNIYGAEAGRNQWLAYGTDTLLSTPPCACNTVVTDTITVTGGNGIMFRLRGSLDYLVVIPSEGIDIDYAADDGMLVSSSAGVQRSLAPLKYLSLAAGPNPCNPVSTLRLDMPSDNSVRLEVYSIAGKLTRVIAAGQIKAGAHSFVWDGKDESSHPVSAGVYIYRLRAGNRVLSVKTVLAR